MKAFRRPRTESERGRLAQGAVLVETLVLLSLILIPFFYFHIDLIQRYRKKFDLLQGERKTYDGLRSAEIEN